MKYTVGVKLVYRYDNVMSNGDRIGVIHGEVIKNFKLPGDTCVRWETGQEASYDVEWLDEHTEVVMGD